MCRMYNIDDLSILCRVRLGNVLLDESASLVSVEDQYGLLIQSRSIKMHIETYLHDEIIHHVQSEGEPEGNHHMMTDTMKENTSLFTPLK